jgi:uncharacterized protein (DUF2336 family)
MRGDRGKKERLFRAAVTAFCSLTRPSRSEIAQLEDLTLPLYDGVSVEARRFVAAALSEVEYPPAGLVRRLAGETVDIAAAVLLRSNALTDIDLIALIGRHGLGHARVIARRAKLNPTIAQLVSALVRTEKRAAADDAATHKDRSMQPAPPAATATATATEIMEAVPDRKEPGDAAEDVRDKLRAMMRPASPETREWPGIDVERGARPAVHSKLRDTALTGVREFFQTALADALDIDFQQARSITARSGFADLSAALKFLELSEEQAFVIAAALHPPKFGHPEAIRLFLDRYRLTHREAAADRVRGWKAATLSASLRPAPTASTRLPADHLPANSPGRPAFGRALKAS